jgi:hypothetical protein
MPFMIEDIRSDINFKKRDSDLAGMIVLLTGIESFRLMPILRQSCLGVQL